jgi:ubiquinone/menaquinone biosynthesis C-methylase UbiE
MSKSSTERILSYPMTAGMQYSDRGEYYAKCRPSYPTAAIDTILKGLGDPSQLTAADVGAGTGIASRLLAERGLRVMAIEPSASMIHAAEPHPLVEFSHATAEQTKLPKASVDLIISCQAFHWFNPVPTLSEFRRILKSSGRLALVWNDPAADDKFFAEFELLVKASLISAPKQETRRPLLRRLLSQSYRALRRLLQSSPHFAQVRHLSSSPHFGHVRHYKFTHREEADLSSTIGHALSKAFTPQEGPAHQKFISDLQELHARWADERGFVSFVYCTNVYLAEPKS